MPTGLDAVAWARRMVEAGAGEILLTSMDRDGTRDGFDLALTRAVSDAVSVPVIASGGVGTREHLAEGILEGHADAVLAASVFHFGDFTVRDSKQYMQSRGIEVAACEWTGWTKCPGTSTGSWPRSPRMRRAARS